MTTRRKRTTRATPPREQEADAIQEVPQEDTVSQPEAPDSNVTDITSRFAVLEPEVPQEVVTESELPEPAPEPAPEIALKSNGRSLSDDESENDKADEALAAAVAAAREEEKPKPPIGRWAKSFAKTSSPLDSVLHQIVPAQPSGLPLVGSGGMAYAMSACGYTFTVDRELVLSPKYEADPTAEKCGWCVAATGSAPIPAYDSGKRRPILPGMLERAPRQKRDPALEAARLKADEEFAARLDSLQAALARMESGEWAPTQEELAELQADMKAMRVANQERTEKAAAAPAPRSSGTRTVMRTAKQTEDGTAGSTLPEIRKNGKLLGILFRTFDPKGPFLVGDGTKRWTVRDIRSNDDVFFGVDKKAALTYLDEQLAQLTEDERTQGAEQARDRMQTGDPTNRRSR